MPLRLAVIVAEAWLATEVVFTVNVADSRPAGTVTETGTMASPRLLDSFTTIPPAGAAPFNVTAPVVDNPPVTTLGFKLTESRTEGVTVSEPVAEDLPTDAVIVATFCSATAEVFAVNVMLDCPAGTVTEPGTETALRLLERRTAVPPLGERPLSVTMPLEAIPPATVVGFRLTDNRPIGIIVNVVVSTAPLSLAVIVATVWVVTGVVVTGKVADE